MTLQTNNCKTFTSEASIILLLKIYENILHFRPLKACPAKTATWPSLTLWNTAIIGKQFKGVKEHYLAAHILIWHVLPFHSNAMERNRNTDLRPTWTLSVPIWLTYSFSLDSFRKDNVKEVKQDFFQSIPPLRVRSAHWFAFRIKVRWDCDCHWQRMSVWVSAADSRLQRPSRPCRFVTETRPEKDWGFVQSAPREDRLLVNSNSYK